MFTKKDIQDLLNDLDLNESMTIHYEGFTGRGINGVSGHNIAIKQDYEIDSLVQFINGYDDKIKIYLTELKLTDRYIKASFKKHKKDKYDKDYNQCFTCWTTVIPYDKINSIDIKEINVR